MPMDSPVRLTGNGMGTKREFVLCGRPKPASLWLEIRALPRGVSERAPAFQDCPPRRRVATQVMMLVGAQSSDAARSLLLVSQRPGRGTLDRVVELPTDCDAAMQAVGMGEEVSDRRLQN